MSRILVTGGNGFIGYHAATELSSLGHDVLSVSRSGDAPEGVKGIKTDFLEPEDTKALFDHYKPDILLHLAWEMEHRLFWEAPINREWLAASSVMLDSFFQNAGQRVVVAGTCAEYDWQSLDSSGVANEKTTPVKPRTLYAATKHALNQKLQTLAEEGKSCIWARLFFMYGEREQAGRLVASTILSLLQAKPVQIANGNKIRDFLDTRDVGRAFAQLCESDATGIVNVGSGEGTTIADIVAKIGSILQKSDLIETAAKTPAGSHDPDALVADVSRLKNEISFKPEINLQKGLENAVSYWLKNQEHDDSASAWKTGL